MDPIVGLVIVAAGVLGLAVGSFLNVVVHRVPQRLSIVKPPSACPSCSTPIAARDNVPVLSWLVLRGRCRTCGTGISARYPIVEAAGGVLFALVALRLGASWLVPAYCAWVAGLLALSAIDLDTFLLPNRVLYPTLALTAGLLVPAAIVEGEAGRLPWALVGGAIGFGLLLVVHLVRPDGMGFGDVRLAGLNGFALGFLSVGHVFVALFLGFALGSIIGVAVVAAGRRGRRDAIPFGPFLALGAVLALLVGEPILRWYGVG